MVSYGAQFERNEDGSLAYTKEGAHSTNRIIFHEDVTGKEITSTLLREVQKLSNVELLEYTPMVDILEKDNHCYGAVIRRPDGSLDTVTATYTVLASGGVGGLYRHSTNFRHLTGDALAIASKHNIELQNPDYVQIDPTTFYTKHPEDRSFLISESVRGEGARLYDKNMNRFVKRSWPPRDLLSEKIHEQMAKDGTDFVWEDLRTIPAETLRHHFPNIVAHCKEMGYDVFKECIPVVPAQHYFMGGVKVNHKSRSSMENLYVVGEAACNGVHGKNRLASNSLLESLVFARRAAQDMAEHDLKDVAENTANNCNTSAGNCNFVDDAANTNASSQNASEVADYLAAHVDFTPYQNIQSLDETYHHLATQAITLGQNPEGRKEFLYV